VTKNPLPCWSAVYLTGGLIRGAGAESRSQKEFSYRSWGSCGKNLTLRGQIGDNIEVRKSFPASYYGSTVTDRLLTMLNRPLANDRFTEVNSDGAMLSHSCKSTSAVASRVIAKERSQIALRMWLLLALIAVGLLVSGRAFGQAAGFKAEPLPAEISSKAAVSAMERAKAEGLTKADLTPQWASFSAFQAYYQRYLFGKLKDPAYLAEYGKIMQSVLDDLERAHKNDRANKSLSPTARLLSTWIVGGAGAIAADNYHPAARINAALLLAYVDDEAADPRTNSPPKPAAAALMPMVQLYRTETNPDGVRAVALQGLLRHVRLGAVTDPRFRTGIAGLMLQLAESDPPANRSPEAHAYMQRYAVDILSFLANPNTTAKTAETFVSLSTTQEKPNLIAAYAASKMGQLKPGQGKVSSPSKVLASWAARAAATIDAEIARIAKLDPPKAVRDQPAMPTEQTPMMNSGQGAYGAAMGMEMSPGSEYGSEMMPDMYNGMNPGMGMLGADGMMVAQVKPQPLEVITGRRRINHVLQQLQNGVTGQPVSGQPRTPAGLLVSATENDKAVFDKWITTVAGVVTAINSETLDDRVKFVEVLQAQSAELKKLAGMPADPNSTAIAAPGSMDDLDALAGPPMPTVVPASASGPVSVPPAGTANPNAAVGPVAVPPPGQDDASAALIAPPAVDPAQPAVQPPAGAQAPAPPNAVVPNPSDDLLDVLAP